MLNLAEELLVLALDDSNGKVHSSAAASLEFGLAGAILMDLGLAGKLSFEQERLEVVDAAPVGDSILDHTLVKVVESRHDRNLAYWVRNGLGFDHLTEDLLGELRNKGILSRTKHKVLWIFPATRHPQKDAGPERDLRERIRAVVLQGQQPEPRVAALLALVKACGLADEIFYSEERERAHKRIDEISDYQLVGDTISGTVAQTQVALQVALMSSVTAATASATAACNAGGTTTC